MAKKTVCYQDPLNDDFASNNLSSPEIPADFPFAVTNIFWRILEFIVYWIIGIPIIFLIGKIGFGLRIRNRKVLKKLKGTGFYLYANHTQEMMDAYSPHLAMFPRHDHIIVSPPAVSLPFVRKIVQFLGGIPIPSTAKGFPRFLGALSLRIREKRVITIYPEAHIWPWYTGIRPFPATSFAYPVRDNVPVLAMVTTYRERKIFKKLWPCITLTLSEPFFPDPAKDQRSAKQDLRDKVYDFMCREVSRPDNYVYVEYVQTADAPAESSRNAS